MRTVAALNVLDYFVYTAGDFSFRISLLGLAFFLPVHMAAEQEGEAGAKARAQVRAEARAEARKDAREDAREEANAGDGSLFPVRAVRSVLPAVLVAYAVGFQRALRLAQTQVYVRMWRALNGETLPRKLYVLAWRLLTLISRLCQ